MDFTPSDYAKIIGITSAPDGFTTSLPSQDQMKQLVAMRQRMEDDTVYFSGPFYDEFSARYLPSFLRAYFNTSWNVGNEFFNLLSTSLSSMITGISFARFVRENLDEVASFLLVQLRRLCPLFHEAYLALDPASKSTKRISALLMMEDGLSLFGPFSAAFLSTQHHLRPSLTSFTPPEDVLHPLHLCRRDARSVFSAVLSLYSERVDDRQDRMTYDGLKKFLKLLDSGSLTYSEDYEGLYDLLWWKCDVFADLPGTTHPPCVDGPLFMCSKCRGVRYCCRDHQKLRWKEHKAICLEPWW